MTPMKNALALAALLLAPLAGAGEVKVNVSSKKDGITLSRDIRVDRDKLSHEDVTVAKGETVSGDIVTTGDVQVHGTVEGSVVSFGGDAEVSGLVHGDVVLLGGEAAVSGQVTGALVSMGGDVKLSGRVVGDVASMGGDVEMGKGSSVGRDVALMGGQLKKEGDAKIGGSVTQLNWRMMKSLMPLVAAKTSALAKAPEKRSAEISAAMRMMSAVFYVAFTLAVGLVLMLLAVFLPKEIGTMGAAIRDDFWTSAGVGTLIAVLLLPGLLLLVISILGIPLIPLALLLLALAAVMGLAAFSSFLTERACQSLGRAVPALPVAVILGYVLLKILPIVGKLAELAGASGAGTVLSLSGLMLSAVGAVAGLGAAWNTRLGRRAA